MFTNAKIAALFPGDLLEQLAIIHKDIGGEVYLVGGSVRDLVLGRSPGDLDLTVSHNAELWAEQLRNLTGGTYVELGREEDAARIVLRQGLDVDFSSFRSGAQSIVEDLELRDITVNALAVPVYGLLAQDWRDEDELLVIDPTGGLTDLKQQQIRVISEKSFADDPLRMLRVFRFAAVLDFIVMPETLEQVWLQRESVERVAKERVAYELDLIMGSPRAHQAFSAMRDCGLLWQVLPELQAGQGMNQPASHHLDVFEHCLEALNQMERVLAGLERYFPETSSVMERYLEGKHRRVQLKWAALLHDVGKPYTYGINEAKGGRITFYNHDLRGADILTEIARRLRWAKEDTSVIARLIAGHMRPFFLANNQRQDRLTLKACLRLVRKIGEHLPGLFLLAMSDALAGKGEASPEDIEQEVAGIFFRLLKVEEEHVVPVRTAPALITGKDLIDELGLTPGPLFRILLERVEEAHMEHRISTREEALALASSEARKRTR
ncbi:MAG: HD domain-containing protein [Candidatus Electrothrix aestuarii]|uniref:HD domain-containing protein n=1 Tax=Candidatus Electrothrix aestuarii TaxID=3062594 RepID=A0AAU8M151_9BACT|nr:HD domain-containing protein [Candidatus Electrothrix aestuarii]